MKKLLIFALSLVFLFPVAAGSISDVQVIEENNPVYEKLYELSREAKLLQTIKSYPLTVGEMKVFFNQIDYEKLSSSGKETYAEVKDFLYEKPKRYQDWGGFLLTGDIELTPEGYFCTNENIPVAHGLNFQKDFLRGPVDFAVSPYFGIGLVPYIGKKALYMKESSNRHNLPLSAFEFEFVMPKFAYGSLGYFGENWNLCLRTGKEGLSIGKTTNGSIIYNQTFETDAYVQFLASTKRFSYTLDTVQIDKEKYLYLHQLDVRFWDNFTVSLMEGTMAVNPFELRYLNPLMVMHSFDGWDNYRTDEQKKIDDAMEGKWTSQNEWNFCAYFCAMFEFIPVQNSRIYLLYSQNELRAPGEGEDTNPNSFGGQLGFDYDIPLSNKGRIYTNGEFFYATPFMYIKQQKKSCLYREQRDAAGKITETWIGLPYGPDCIGGSLTLGYKMGSKWSVQFDYLFKAKGQIDFDTLKETTEKEYGGYTVSSYYPTYVDSSQKDNIKTMLPTGTVEYMNRFGVKGIYYLNQKFSFASQVVFTQLLNASHIKDNTQSGVEIDLSGTWRIHQ